jgi:hypothetical protein
MSSILGRVRLVRQTGELVDLVRDLRRVERATVIIESGPVEIPEEIADDAPTERMHAPSARLSSFRFV